jgi:carboxypeptidase Taq
MYKNLKKIKKIIYEITDINHAAAVLGWDQETYMPKGGINDRANQLATLNKIAHEKFISKEVGDLIEGSKTEIEKIDANSNDSRLIKVIDRNYQKNVKVPSKLVSEMSKASSLGQQSWAKAKQKSDFSIFEPFLKKQVTLRQEYAKIFTPYNHIYDVLLDDFEPGLKTADVKEIFSKLRPQQIKLIKAISQKEEVNELHGLKPVASDLIQSALALLFSDILTYHLLI